MWPGNHCITEGSGMTNLLLNAFAVIVSSLMLSRCQHLILTFSWARLRSVGSTVYVRELTWEQVRKPGQMFFNRVLYSLHTKRIIWDLVWDRTLAAGVFPWERNLPYPSHPAVKPGQGTAENSLCWRCLTFKKGLVWRRPPLGYFSEGAAAPD